MKNNLDMIALRSKLGITQQILAEMLEVDRKYVSMIETGIKPLSKKLAIKLERIAASEVHKREQTWTKNPDGAVSNLQTNESGNPTLPLPSQFNKDISASARAAPPRESLPVPCANCARLEREVDFLRTQLSEALTRIPKPPNS